MYPYCIPVSEMKTRGYSTETIREGEKAECLCQLIEKAFANVTLGAGVSLRQSRAMDDYSDITECRRVRAIDEQSDWKSVSIDALNEYAGSFAFFDAEGVRFYLPALLLADLRGSYGWNVVEKLVDQRDAEKFTLLSDEQRSAVRAFLFYVAAEPTFGNQHPQIQNALIGFWAN